LVSTETIEEDFNQVEDLILVEVLITTATRISKEDIIVVTEV